MRSRTLVSLPDYCKEVLEFQWKTHQLCHAHDNESPALQKWKCECSAAWLTDHRSLSLPGVLFSQNSRAGCPTASPWAKLVQGSGAVEQVSLNMDNLSVQSV